MAFIQVLHINTNARKLSKPQDDVPYPSAAEAPVKFQNDMKNPI